MEFAHRLTACAVALLGTVALVALPAAAAAKDRNHDRIPDRWEKRHHLSTKVNQAQRDQDRDQMRNRAEFLAGDNPRDRDSDDDGVIDGDENAGTVQSFDPSTGGLTISLFGGDTLSGTVDETTEIKCEHEDSGAASASSEGGDNQEGSEDNGGEEEPGDDNGGDEQGDDNEDNAGPGSSSSGPGSGEDNQGEASCTTADLVPGAVVQEAELMAVNGTATFEEVELAG